MSEMMIGEVARRARIRPSAIRYYESVGVLTEPRRSKGQRRYGPDVLIRLAGIGVAQQAGFTITEIKHLFHGFADNTTPGERWSELAREKLVEIEELIRHAKSMRDLLEEGIRCGCTRLEECAPLKRSRGTTSS